MRNSIAVKVCKTEELCKLLQKHETFYSQSLYTMKFIFRCGDIMGV